MKVGDEMRASLLFTFRIDVIVFDEIGHELIRSDVLRVTAPVCMYGVRRVDELTCGPKTKASSGVTAIRSKVLRQKRFSPLVHSDA